MFVLYRLSSVLVFFVAFQLLFFNSYKIRYYVNIVRWTKDGSPNLVLPITGTINVVALGGSIFMIFFSKFVTH